jgi:hypothetical protein
MYRLAVCLCTLVALTLIGGCPPENFASLLPATQVEIDRIRDDDALTPQEAREQLRALGLADLTINALLQDRSLGNQFGGDLRSAYLKLTAPDFTELTPDEIQVFATRAPEVDEEVDVNVADDQAQAIVNFFNGFDIRSSEDLQAHLDGGGSVPGAVDIDTVTTLFIDFDPELLLPLLP